MSQERNVYSGKPSKGSYTLVVTSTADVLSVQVKTSDGDNANGRFTFLAHQVDTSYDGATGADLATAGTDMGLDVLIQYKLFGITTNNAGLFTSAATATDVINVIGCNGESNIVTII